MAPDVPSDAMMTYLISVRDDSSEEVSDPAKRTYQPNKCKFIKQFIGIFPNKEHVSQQHFKELAHTILRAVGSQIHELIVPPSI